MAQIKLSSEEIFKEYQSLNLHNTRLDLYETVKRNYNFYIGNQWEGVNALNLPKPTLNILKRVVSYFISMLVSDDISINVENNSSIHTNEQAMLFDAVKQECDVVIEKSKLKAMNRQFLKDSAICGDSCYYMWFDPTQKTGELVNGCINVEMLSNTDVFFQNPYSSDLQSQEYILIMYRKSINNIGDVTKKDIKPDYYTADTINNEYVTCIRKLYKKDGIVWVTEVCKDAVITKPKPLGYTLYPLVWFNWEKVRNSYHGQSPLTPVIQNQIDINRLFAMCIKQVKDGAFPKIIYNKTLMPNGYDNAVGKAIGVNGDVERAMVKSTGVSEMSNQVLSMINLLITYTKETMGATDAALGNVMAQNTSAIIALQKSSAMPLELQRLDFYQAIEDCILVFINMMSVNYGKRYITTMVNNNPKKVLVDFDVLKDLQLSISVDVGASAYWSEISGIATLDNLFSKGVFTDVKTYIESLPRGSVPNRDKILKAINDAQNLQQQGLQNDIKNNKKEVAKR